MIECASMSRRMRRVVLKITERLSSRRLRTHVFAWSHAGPSPEGPVERAQLRKLQKVCDFGNLGSRQQIQSKSSPQVIKLLSVGCAAALKFALQGAAAEGQLSCRCLKTNITTGETVAQNPPYIVQEVVFVRLFQQRLRIVIQNLTE